jgi:hypothetical protein
MLNCGARPDQDYPRLIADLRSGRINVRDPGERGLADRWSTQSVGRFDANL